MDLTGSFQLVSLKDEIRILFPEATRVMIDSIVKEFCLREGVACIADDVLSVQLLGLSVRIGTYPAIDIIRRVLRKLGVEVGDTGIVADINSIDNSSFVAALKEMLAQRLGNGENVLDRLKRLMDEEDEELPKVDEALKAENDLREKELLRRELLREIDAKLECEKNKEADSLRKEAEKIFAEEE